MTQAREPTGSLDAALAHAERLLQTNPVLAVEQAGEILKAVPNHPVATLLLGVAQRASGETAAAVKTLKDLCDSQHRWAQAHYELGIVMGEADLPAESLKALKRAVELKPDLPDGWRALGDVLTLTGDTAGADTAYASHIKVSTRDPRLLAPAAALCENRIAEAEALLRAHLRQYPTDVAAIRMLAEVAARLGGLDDAEALLAHCLELAPSFSAARYNYAVVLHRQNKPAAALLQVEQLLKLQPRHPGYRNLKAVVLVKIGDYQESIDLYAGILELNPANPSIWLNYAHALSTAGRDNESIEAYRKGISLLPGYGEAYWSLANLKTFRFSTAEIQIMRDQLARADLKNEDRFHFHFALGKALEDSKSFEESFEHYALGNKLRRAGVPYDGEENTDRVRRAKLLFTADFFRSRADFGSDAADPIFIVGLPRSGSTLIEQILATHSLVEGTMELPNIIGMARELNGKKRRTDVSKYPEVLAELSAAECRALGERYLAETRIQRKTDKPFFIDKMPNNFMHTGMIHLILPRARIIDARRHPMACCFSGFKQHFAMGQHYTYDLGEIGRYYRDYVQLMAHFDAVLPGRVHRVIYEQMIEDTEAEVRTLLTACGLPFEEACLRFYDNDRAVRTASAHQVRQPIFRDGVEQWRHYEPWLAPLSEALGPVLAAYPAAP